MGTPEYEIKRIIAICEKEACNTKDNSLFAQGKGQAYAHIYIELRRIQFKPDKFLTLAAAMAALSGILIATILTMIFSN